MTSMNDIKSCVIHWRNGRSDNMELGSGMTIVYLIAMRDFYKKIEFDFAGYKWVALDNPKGEAGVMLAGSDLRKQIFVPYQNDMNRFIDKVRVALRGLLYDINETAGILPHPDALVAMF